MTELEKLKLPVPNSYGTTVKIERVNMLIERAYKAGLATATQQAVGNFAVSIQRSLKIYLEQPNTIRGHKSLEKTLDTLHEARQALSKKGSDGI